MCRDTSLEKKKQPTSLTTSENHFLEEKNELLISQFSWSLVQRFWGFSPLFTAFLLGFMVSIFPLASGIRGDTALLTWQSPTVWNLLPLKFSSFILSLL